MNDIVIQLGFGVHDAFERTESLQMGATDIGDETVVGFGYIDEFLDISRVGGTHLDDGHLVCTRDLQ